MTYLTKNSIGETYSQNPSWELLQELSDIKDRMGGHSGERSAARAIQNAFKENGLGEINIEEFRIPGWWRGSSRIDFENYNENLTADRQLISLPGSPNKSVNAEITDLGFGTSEEFDTRDISRKIVMVLSTTPDNYDYWIHRQNKYWNAIDEGAAGFIFRNHINGCLPPTGTVGPPTGYGEIPAVGVSKEVGSRIARYVKNGVSTAKLSTKTRRDTATSRNVEGVIGPDGRNQILITAHLDAHDIGDGAMDNGFGCALAVDMARLLWDIEHQLNSQIRFVIFGSEEVGRHGANHWASTRDLSDVKAVLNLDGIGNTRNLKVVTNGYSTFTTIFRKVCKSLNIEMAFDTRTRAVGDGWEFLRRGIPVVQARSDTENSDRGWGHTSADTLDKIDIRDFRDLSVAIASGVANLAIEQPQLEIKSVNEIMDSLDQGSKQNPYLFTRD